MRRAIRLGMAAVAALTLTSAWAKEYDTPDLAVPAKDYDTSSTDLAEPLNEPAPAGGTGEHAKGMGAGPGNERASGGGSGEPEAKEPGSQPSEDEFLQQVWTAP